MKPLYILKLGGSVVTYKNRSGFSVRKNLLKKIASSINIARKKEKFDLILIHGAGALGHQLAHKYGLKTGTTNNAKKIRGALMSRIANQKLDGAIIETLVSEGLPVVAAHTASVIIQKNKKISDCNIGIIKESLRKNYIPVLYGEMVFDEVLGMTICSGDSIAPYLAEKLKAQKIFFASDIDGIFDKDPYLNKDAKLIENINLSEILNDKKIKLSKSHNIDATDGILGKIININISKKSFLHSVEIFNGLKEKNYKEALLGKEFSHSRLYFSR